MVGAGFAPAGPGIRTQGYLGTAIAGVSVGEVDQDVAEEDWGVGAHSRAG